MTDDVAAIVKGLTKAQREAMSAKTVSGETPKHIPSVTKARCRAALQDKGLVERPMYSERLTPLGLAVRNYLETVDGE